MAEEEQPGQIDVPLVWVGAEELPVLYLNQFIAQVNRGEIFLTLGQVVPPPIVGATEEERKAQAESIEFVPVKPVARLAFTPGRLQELIQILQITLDNHETQQRSFGDPRHLNINHETVTTETRSSVTVEGTRTEATTRPPLMVSRDEAFFWTGGWQYGERESAAARERGEVRTFGSSQELIDWLRSDED